MMNRDTVMDAARLAVGGGPVRGGISRGEWVGAGLVFALALVLRVVFIRTHVWNSDEPQHLHVVWAWAHGRLPYRDVFDNHSPLFSWLCSPLFRLLGERADIVEWMRVAMVPLYGVSVWCIYRLGVVLFSRRAGLWAAVIGGVYPPWFTIMGEFRTDVLWTTLWLVTLVILLTGRLTLGRLFCAGLALGATFSVSMKTTLLLLSMGGGGLCVVAVGPWLRRIPAGAGEEVSFWKRALALLGGLLVVPGGWVLFFAAQGAWGEFYYGLITHNIVPRVDGAALKWTRLGGVNLVRFAIGILAGGLSMPLLARDRGQAQRRVFLFVVAGLFYPLLHGLWPVVTAQDDMPHYPILAVVIAGMGAMLFESRASSRALRFVLPALVFSGAIAEFTVMLRWESIHDRSNLNRIQGIQDLLTLTDASDFVLDAKGNTIFRERPYFYAIETLTAQRAARGLLADDVPEHLIATRTAVVILSKRMTERTKDFLEQNYVGVGHYTVAGKHLSVAGKYLPAPDTDGAIRFDIALPQQYMLLTKHGLGGGTLDGLPLDGPRELASGPHIFWPPPHTTDHFTLLWSRAYERGFSPFTKDSPDDPDNEH